MPVLWMRKHHTDPTETIAIAQQCCRRNDLLINFHGKAPVRREMQKHVPVAAGLIPFGQRGQLQRGRNIRCRQRANSSVTKNGFGIHGEIVPGSVPRILCAMGVGKRCSKRLRNEAPQ